MSFVGPEAIGFDPYYNESATGIGRAVDEDVDVRTIFDQIVAGEICPFGADYLEPIPPMTAGIEAITYTQPRVESFRDGEIVERRIVKLKTMHDLTPRGQQLITLLKAAENLTVKELGGWRVARPLLRKMSADEVPQLACNVLDLFTEAFVTEDQPDPLLNMQLFGGARPPLRSEIVRKGDNSNDMFGQALEQVAETKGLSPDDMYSMLGDKYVPGLITPAAANGSRQLSSVDGYKHWMNGIIAYDRISRLPHLARSRALGRICIDTAKHVVKRTDAE